MNIEERRRVASPFQANNFSSRQRTAVAHRPDLTRVDSPGTSAEDSRALAVVRRASKEDDVESIAVFLRLVRRHLRAPTRLLAYFVYV
jgi:hypothetical protein